MSIAEPVDRRRMLREAIDAYRGNPDATMTNAEFYGVWGVSKGRWTDIRNKIPGFPAPVMKGNEQHYPALAGLQAMWGWETRNDQMAAEKSKRTARLLGMDEFKDSAFTLSDLQRADALRASMEQRMIGQRELVAAADVQAMAARVGELLSRRLSNLGTIIDPNGMLPVETRQNVDDAGKELLLSIRKEMLHTLSPDANAVPPRSSKNGSRARRTGGAKVSPKRI